MTTPVNKDISSWYTQGSTPLKDGSYPSVNRGGPINPDSEYSGYTNYYVATTGDDVSGDGSIGNPWQTIQYGLNQLTTGGNRLYVRGGTYTETAETANYGLDGIMPVLNCNYSGSAGAGYIVLQGYPGESVIIDQGGATSPYRGGIYINNKDYIAIHDIEITDTRTAGIKLADNISDAYQQSNIRIVKCHIHYVRGTSGDNVGGIRFDSGTNGLIQNNIIHNVDIDSGAQTNAACIHAYRMNNTDIEFNKLYDSANGVFWKQAAQADGNVEIRYNHINADWEGLRLGYQGSGYPGIEDSNFHHNLIINAHWGIQLYQGEDDVLYPCDNVKIYNNTIADGILNGGELAAAIKCDGATNLQIYNNLISDIGWPIFATRNTGTETVTNTISDCDDNFYHTFSQFRLDWYLGAPDYSYSTLSAWQTDSKSDSAMMIVTNSGPDLSATEADPLFTDQANDDYTLQGTSTALTAARDGGACGCYNRGYVIGPDWSL